MMSSRKYYYSKWFKLVGIIAIPFFILLSISGLLVVYESGKGYDFVDVSFVLITFVIFGGATIHTIEFMCRSSHVYQITSEGVLRILKNGSEDIITWGQIKTIKERLFFQRIELINYEDGIMLKIDFQLHGFPEFQRKIEEGYASHNTCINLNNTFYPTPSNVILFVIVLFFFFSMSYLHFSSQRHIDTVLFLFMGGVLFTLIEFLKVLRVVYLKEDVIIIRNLFKSKKIPYASILDVEIMYEKSFMRVQINTNNKKPIVFGAFKGGLLNFYSSINAYRSKFNKQDKNSVRES